MDIHLLRGLATGIFPPGQESIDIPCIPRVATQFVTSHITWE